MAASVASATGADYILRQNALAAPQASVPVTAPLAQDAASAPAGGSAATQAPLWPSLEGRKVRIGLLLPQASPLLGEAASVVRAGFAAALASEARADVGVTEYAFADRSGLEQAYRALVAQGVNVVVGPMTRGEIGQLAPLTGGVPVLALNTTEGLAPRPKLYSLSLSVEAEARQVASLMKEDGVQRPLLVFGADTLSQRLRDAFLETWTARRGTAPAVLAFDTASGATLDAALSGADAVFFALPARESAQLKMILPSDRPVYATSLVNVRESLPALSGVRFVDMPWLLMPEHPLVRQYPRPAQALTVPTERLYALGVDAYRLALRLAGTPPAPGARVDGVTGELRLQRDLQFQRTLPRWVKIDSAQP